MTVNRLGLAWVLVVVAFVVLLGVEFSRWTSLMIEGARIASERRRLTDEIQLMTGTRPIDDATHNSFLLWKARNVLSIATINNTWPPVPADG